MNSPIFYEFIRDGFVPWLEKLDIPRPVIFLVDGRRSYLSQEVSELCDREQVVLYALPPNTTDLLQPAEVAIFDPLKKKFADAVARWQQRADNFNKVLSIRDVAPLLAEIVGDISCETIKEGFRRCGLFPLNKSAPDYSKLRSSVVDTIGAEVEVSSQGMNRRTSMLKPIKENIPPSQNLL